MAGPTVTLSLEDYQALQHAKTQADNLTADTRKQLEVAKFVDADERVAMVTAFARDCLTLARFAIANCPPEVVRGWPYETLRSIAQKMSVLPDCSYADEEMAIDMLAFAREVEQHEIRRRNAASAAPERIEVERTMQVAADGSTKPIE